jgi:hypothetical protein
MVVKFRNTISPPPPQLSLHRRAALSSNSNGTRSFIAERTQNAVYIVRCLCPKAEVVKMDALSDARPPPADSGYENKNKQFYGISYITLLIIFLLV